MKEIAAALVDLGRGSTYTDAAKRVRAQANYGKTSKFREVINGQTVAEWMADFVPVVSQRWRPTKWPAVLVLDSISFRWTDHTTTPKSNLMLYSILAAFGYDQDKAISGGIEQHWGQWATVNLVHHCEFHLSARGTSRMNSDKLDLTDPARQLFHGALKSRERWDAFEAEVRSRPELLNSNNWLDLNAIKLRVQTFTRENIPPVYSNSAASNRSAISAALWKAASIRSATVPGSTTSSN